ncbi:MAG: hypothetical protein AAGA58_01470 [Verrucomicrobiota bacterium]
MNVLVLPSGDALPEGDETVVMTLASGAGYTLGGTTSATVTIHDLPFDNFRFTNFTAAELANPLISGPRGDGSDSDGNVVFIEYATGRSPSVSEPSAITITTIENLAGDRFPAVIYRRLVNATDVVYVVEQSDDLEDWSAVDVDMLVEESVTSNGDGTETVVVRTTEAITSGNPRKYLRVFMQGLGG